MAERCNPKLAVALRLALSAAALELVLLISSLAVAASCPRGTLTGEVTRVRDGDTIEVGGMAIRLQGLAAPESGEPGAQAATRAMVEFRARRSAASSTARGRTIAVSRFATSRTGIISAEMVRAGVARNCRAFSGGRYAALEQAAAANGANIREAYTLPGYCR
jgi:micrococcal nuclease